MIVKAMTFIGLLILYFFVMIPIFQILYQEDSIIYVDGLVTARSLFDTMLGNYGYAVTGVDDNMHASVLVLHIFISNIFLLNYLIAILATVYEDMAELGDFAYKSNKYQYIERFQIAMNDEWGYAELLVHPPPINYLTGLILFSVFKDNMMLRASSAFSKLIFWLENLVFFIPYMMLYEAMLIPVIYLQIVYNILRVEIKSPHTGIFWSIMWLIIGPFYLFYAWLNDMYFYLKVLFEYNEEVTSGATIEEKADQL